jgi:cytochrome oxidase Cu insertion factor (SCO1/SenC/PrrC family)
MFGGHAFNIAAAASTAKIFTDKSDELIPLMEPFLNSAFRDQWIDITTPELNYPITNPTKVRYEIIHTFIAYGASAYRSVKVLNEIVECGNCDSYGHDSILYIKATKAIEYLRKVTPACCRKENIDKTVQTSIRLIDKQDRGMVSMSHLKFIDQDGQNIIFDDLKAKPFVLTFFYTQCANPLKCASTVHRLGELEKECIKNNLMNKIGIYGMTYDSDFDTPKILKKYGKMYGVTFNNHMKFLKTVDPSTAGLSDQLQLRVNYGAGSVNQHGIQLFIFDKNEKIAALSDNEVWAVDDVYKILLELTKE